MDAPPARVVAWFAAIQAQDYLAALWALGLRTAKATEATIEAAIADGSVLRTHVFRGTWQYVTREDVRWMLDLVGARVIAASASRYRELELDERTLRACCALFARALEGGNQLTRREMTDVLMRGRISAVNSRLLHILGHAELAGVITSGGRRGKQPTFALLDDRAPIAKSRTRDESLAELGVRYFQSRGPALVRDFVWWTGLTVREARLAVELAGPWLESRAIGGETWWMAPGNGARRGRDRAHLLPAFDEYLVGYADRSAMVDPQFMRKVNAGGGMLKPAVVVDGQVIGTWSRTLGKGTVSVIVSPFRTLTKAQREAIRRAIERYAAFLGLTVR